MATTHFWGSPPFLVALPRAESWDKSWQPQKRLSSACDRWFSLFFASLFSVTVLSYIRKRVSGSGGLFGMVGDRTCARSIGGGSRAQPEHAATGTVLQHSHKLQIHRPQSCRAPMAGPLGAAGSQTARGGEHVHQMGRARHGPNSSENLTGCLNSCRLKTAHALLTA